MIRLPHFPVVSVLFYLNAVPVICWVCSVRTYVHSVANSSSAVQ